MTPLDKHSLVLSIPKMQQIAIFYLVPKCIFFSFIFLFCTGCVDLSGRTQVVSYAVAKPISPKDDSKVFSLTPCLRWQPLANGPKPETWQIRVQTNGATIIEVKNLTSLEYQVSTPLPANSKCTWSVRGCAKDTQGNEVVSPWSSMSTWDRSLITAEKILTTVQIGKAFSFSTPNAGQP